MKLLRFVFLLAAAAACTEDSDKQEPVKLEWTKLGLDGKTVNEMQLSETSLYVATTTGLYRKPTNTSEDFILIGFNNENVEAIEVLGDKSLMVSIYDKSGGDEPALFKTENDGQTWVKLESNFGGENPEPVFDLEVHPENNNIIYATGFAAVAKSINGGLEWIPIFGDWGGLATGVSVVELNPFKESEIWAGGQGAIENGFLLRSHDETHWDAWSDLVENPTVVKEIVFSEHNTSEVLVGFEGALLKTSDDGSHWRTLINSEDNRFYFGICRNKRNVNRVYSGGWLKTAGQQQLVLFVSDNAGETWHEHRYPSEAYGGILDMQIAVEGEVDILYIGLDKGGVYRVTVSS